MLSIKKYLESMQHRVDRVLGYFSSRPNGELGPPPLWFLGGGTVHTRLLEKGWGSQFGQGDRHCGTLGIL
jgi:hypothetical protein